MAHRYIVFPANGPLDGAGRPIGKCECGRWEDSTDAIQLCPNAGSDNLVTGSNGGFLPFTAVFKYGKATHTTQFSSWTMDEIRDAVMEKWKSFETEEFHLEFNDIPVNDDFSNKVLSKLAKREVVFHVISDCQGFSKYVKEKDFLELENITKEERALFPAAEVDQTKWHSQISHAIQDLRNKIKLYGPIEQTCEASVREHVSPVLSLAALIAGDILMQCERQVNGLRGNGPVDYIYLYKKFPVTMTEVKDDKVDAGVAQNDAQIVAGRQQYKFDYPVNTPDAFPATRKRKLLEVVDISTVPSFGIIMSGKMWMFQKYVESNPKNLIYKSSPFTIKMDSEDSVDLQSEVMEVVRRIVQILLDQKSAVDNSPVTKKVKNEF